MNAAIVSEPIISVSGLRGVVGETLTPEVAMRYAAAFAAIAPPGEILVGRDSRPSGRMLSLAIHAALQAVDGPPSTPASSPRPRPASCCAATRPPGPSKSPPATTPRPTTA